MRTMCAASPDGRHRGRVGSVAGIGLSPSPLLMSMVNLPRGCTTQPFSFGHHPAQKLRIGRTIATTVLRSGVCTPTVRSGRS